MYHMMFLFCWDQVKFNLNFSGGKTAKPLQSLSYTIMKCTTKCLTEDFTSFRLIIIHHKTRVCYPKVYYPSRYHKLWVCFGLQDKDYRACLTSAPDFQFFLKHLMDYAAQQCLKLNFSALLELSRWAWDLRTQLSFYKVDKISFFKTCFRVFFCLSVLLCALLLTLGSYFPQEILLQWLI